MGPQENLSPFPPFRPLPCFPAFPASPALPACTVPLFSLFPCILSFPTSLLSLLALLSQLSLLFLLALLLCIPCFPCLPCFLCCSGALLPFFPSSFTAISLLCLCFVHVFLAFSLLFPYFALRPSPCLSPEVWSKVRKGTLGEGPKKVSSVRAKKKVCPRWEIDIL